MPPKNDAWYPPWASSVRPAPGDLRIVQAFVNTRDVGRETDELESPESLGAWLARWRLLAAGTPLAERDLRRAREAREALRDLLLANNGAPLDGRTVERLNRAGKGGRLRVSFGRDGSADFDPVTGAFHDAISRLLGLLVTARLEGTWPRLKACRNDRCLWAFYDFSKNRSGKWCSMLQCGNQANARAYRRRKSRSLR